ncbi:LuxR C-terminal-related transcriptional regulator [Fimbriimonas ginsengisoli]|uniref:PAS/PAC sensor protein n=1 Tax=Fimbriimonas ginsengisoli Gsoil 348 TaxID=661478 RepID=A0A068NJC8_FIMGI|nr:LuxR C-terminal-related transcriptional regulator [Fimbriimonas ginsengisoli]AIE83591.1 PAS/PAC sensor protein [Fimbriimonas ginsengisoli Gsoil 348]
MSDSTNGTKLEPSSREREVLEFAVSGFTDEQIAQTLGISVSTVNSYWVRIRSKLGQYSRTQLVATILTERAKKAEESLRLRIAELENEQARLRAELAEATRDLGALGRQGWHAMALDCAPEAVIVFDDDLRIILANQAAERLFGIKEPLKGRCVGSLVARQQQAEAEERLCRYLSGENFARIAMGEEYPVFGRREDGSLFRAIISVEGFRGPAGTMAICVIREFMAEVEARRRALIPPRIGLR